MSKTNLLITGIVLIVLGAVGLFWQKISVTTKETVVQIGDAKLEVEREKDIPLPPILGGIAVAGGIALVVMSSRKR